MDRDAASFSQVPELPDPEQLPPHDSTASSPAAGEPGQNALSLARLEVGWGGKDPRYSDLRPLRPWNSMQGACRRTKCARTWGATQAP